MDQVAVEATLLWSARTASPGSSVASFRFGEQLAVLWVKLNQQVCVHVESINFWREMEYVPAPKDDILACGLFWAEGNQDLVNSGTTFPSNLTIWKNLDRGTVPEKELLPERMYLSERPSAGQGKLLNAKHLHLWSSCEFPSCTGSPRPHPIPQFRVFLDSHCLVDSPTYVIKLVFLLLICVMSLLLLCQPKNLEE